MYESTKSRSRFKINDHEQSNHYQPLSLIPLILSKHGHM